MNIDVSEIQILPVKNSNGLIAFASCVINNCLYLSSIGVHSKLDGSGYRLTYPTRKIGNREINTFHPINREASAAIETAVINKINDVMKAGNND